MHPTVRVCVMSQLTEMSEVKASLCTLQYGCVSQLMETRPNVGSLCMIVMLGGLVQGASAQFLFRFGEDT